MSLLSLAQRADCPALLRAAQAELAAGRPLSAVTHPKSGDSALHVAARAGRPEVLEALLGLGLGVEARNLEGKTALHEAAQAGQEAAVAVLLSAGAEVDAIKRADWTPLMLACTKVENTRVAALLLEAGACPELRNKDGWTAWHLAVRTGDTALLSLLLARAPSSWATTSSNLRSPLHTAALRGDTATLDLLLSPPCSYNLEAADTCGNTALLEAGRGGHREAMERLDREGADRGARDSMGRGVVEVVVQAGNVKCVQLCRDWGLVEGEQLGQEVRRWNNPPLLTTSVLPYLTSHPKHHNSLRIYLFAQK